MATEKRWNIRFLIYELPAAHAEQFVSVEAANMGLALNRGWAEVKKRAGVKGKRFRTGKITFSLEDGKDES